MNVKSAMEEFLLGCEADGLSEKTMIWYRSLIGAFTQVYETTQIKDITARELREYVTEIRKHYQSEDTQSAHIRALHKFWGWLSLEYEFANPMRNIKYPQKPKAKIKAASLEDIAAMYAVAGDGAMGARNRAILAFLLDTGARAGGLIGLKMADLDMEKRKALVTEKGNKTRVVPFTEFTAGVLQTWMHYRQPVDAVFYNMETMQPLTTNGLYQLFRRLARRAGIKGKFNPHSFRHAFAREYIMAGGDLATLAQQLGHRDVSTTVFHYAIFTIDEIAKKHEQYSPVKVLKGRKQKQQPGKAAAV